MGMPGQVPDTSWLPAGMDPKSTYLLKIRLAGNPKKRRKEFSCFHITKVVDSDLCNFKDLVETIVDAYPHSYIEIVSVFYYDEVQKNFPQVTTDQELLAMFNKHVDSKEVRMTITYSEPTDVVSIPESYTQQNAEVLDIPSTPSMPDKSQWPQSDHGYFMHPPLIKSTSGRRQNKRAKGCTEANGSTTKKKGSHQCPICKDYGHRWYNCKDGDPKDIAAMLAEKGPPKRRKKTTECDSSIVPADPGPKTMHFPPSQNASLILDSGNSLKSGSGSNQPETLSIEYPLFTLGETTPPAATSMPIVEKKGKRKAKAQGKKKQQQVTASTDSPVMGT